MVSLGTLTALVLVFFFWVYTGGVRTYLYSTVGLMGWVIILLLSVNCVGWVTFNCLTGITIFYSMISGSMGSTVILSVNTLGRAVSLIVIILGGSLVIISVSSSWTSYKVFSYQLVWSIYPFVSFFTISNAPNVSKRVKKRFIIKKFWFFYIK